MDAQELRNLQEAYMEVYQELDEEITPERRRQYKAGLKVRQANQEADPGKARPRKRPTASRQHPSMRTGMTQDIRDIRRDNEREDHPYRPEGPGGITKNPRKLAQQKARGQHAEQTDIYDIILSHLLDEGYAETPEAAEVIMVNMSEDWRESIVEGGFPGTPSTPRAGDAGTSGLKLIRTPTGQTGYINKHSGGEILPPDTVNKIMSGQLMVKKQDKTNTKTA